MRKVTRLLAAAVVGAFGLTACSDNVVLPPPEPPPPPSQDAEMTIQAVRDADGDPVDPEAVEGRIIVIYNVDGGGQQISQIEVMVDGNPQSCQTVGASQISAGGESAASAPVECIVNTSAISGECTGEQISPAFSNGEHGIGGRLTLADGSTVSATNALTLNFANENRVELVREGGNEAVNNGERYFGGEDMTWHACPVVYDGDVTVGTVEVTPSAAGTLVAFDGGNMATGPFSFLAVAADNAGVEDAAGSPHTIDVTDVVSDEGENLLGLFPTLGQDVRHLDFTPPADPVAGDLQIDGAAITMDYYSAGAFSVAAVDNGAGVDVDATVFTVADAGTGDPVVEGAAGIEDLEEALPDAYLLQVSSVADRVGNVNALDPAVENATTFGKDATPADISAELPATAGIILNDVAVQLDAVDPDLDNANATDPGSGVATVSAETDEDPPTALTVTNPAGDTYEADISVLADGAYVVSVTVEDGAVLTANPSSTMFDFVLDTTDPTLDITTFPQGGNTAATSAQFTIGGEVTDENGLSAVTLTVRVDGADANGGGDGTCQDTDYELDPDAGEIDQNNLDITASADSFSETFVVERPAAPVNPVKYCFFVNADDNALDRNGDAAPNQGAIQTNADVSWQ